MTCQMVLRLKLTNERHATMFSAYAPTMTSSDDVKEAFYEDLAKIIRSVPRSDKLILLGTTMLE